MRTTVKLLLGLLALVLFTSVASAQYVANNTTPLGDGDNPYVGTQYTYTVISPSAVDIEWLVYSADDLNPVNLVDPGASTPAYTISDGTTATASIVWNIPGTYYLTYKETLNNCITYRGVVVIVTDNNFYLNLAANGDACNSEVDNVLNWVTYATKDDVKTELTFTITMSKDAGFSIDNYQFTCDITLPTDVTIVAATDVTVAGGAKAVGTGNGNFTVTALATDAATTGEVTISVFVSGKVTDGGGVTLALTNGRAVKGAIVTADNLTLPASSDRQQIITLKPLAGASNISF